MKCIDLGGGVVITGRRVTAATLVGWVAFISGTDPQYELRRTFVERRPIVRDGTEGRTYEAIYRLPRNGLYEFRGLGADGFFRVSGVFRKRVVIVDRAEVRRAFGLAE